ncbi:MAG TPA: hypothetical protein VFS43_45335 [Polyangiaceae bacterium]|nr:hypothetical protein [Polyangiaceae bacterium]
MTRPSSEVPGEAKAGAAERGQGPASARLPEAQRLLERLRRGARRALGFAVVFSVVCHVGVFFLPRLLALWGLWSESSSIGLVDMPGDVGFAVELEYTEPPAPAAPAAPADAAPAATPAPTEAPKPPPPKPPPPAPPAASLATPRRDGRGGEGGGRPPEAHARAGAGGAGGGQGSVAVRDPVGVSGKAGAVVGRDPNVSILLVTENLRGHPAATELGPELVKIRQWRSFFGPTTIDPIRDTDRILVAGPQFRDTSKISAVIKFRLTESKLREAIDDLRGASDPPGEWVSESPPTAKVHADGADRYMVLGGGGIAMMVPEGALEQAKRGVSFPPARPGEVLVFYLRYPARALRGLPFALPQSLASVRIGGNLRPDGGADVIIDALDKDAASASTSARTLSAGLEAASVREVPLLGRIRLFDPIEFHAEGDHVKATVRLNAAQTREMARLVASMLAQMSRGEPPGLGTPQHR